MKEIIITVGDAGQRLDKYLQKYFNAAPRSFVFKMLRKKRIKLNGKKSDGSNILAAGDRLTMYIADETAEQLMEKCEIYRADRIEIVYEDENLLLINKPVGVLSHPSDRNDHNTLIDRALHYLNQKGEFNSGADSTFIPVLCNRLDRNTSGIIICGKNLGTVQSICKVIESQLIQKYYLAVVGGEIKAGATLEGIHVKDGNKNVVNIIPINADEPTGVNISASSSGKEAITHYEPLDVTYLREINTRISLVRIKLVTGRSHQIRAHMSSIGHPLIGDPKYGNVSLNKWLSSKHSLKSQLLHSEMIAFAGLCGRLSYLSGKTFISPLPGDFNEFITEYFGYDQILHK